MPKLNQGGGSGQVPGKGLVPDAPPFNKQAHDREHFPNTETARSWSLTKGATSSNAASLRLTDWTLSDPGPSNILTWDTSRFVVKVDAVNAVLIPEGMGALYHVTGGVFTPAHATSWMISTLSFTFGPTLTGVPGAPSDNGSRNTTVSHIPPNSVDAGGIAQDLNAILLLKQDWYITLTVDRNTGGILNLSNIYFQGVYLGTSRY